MSYIDNNLLANEDVLYHSRMHWVIFLSPIIWTLFTIILAFSSSIIQVLALVTGAVAIITWTGAAINYFTSEYALTTKRVVMKEGFFKRVSLELFLQKIEGIQVQQGICGRLFGFGTIIIIGTGGTRDPFSLLYDPLTFRRNVQEQIEKLSHSS